MKLRKILGLSLCACILGFSAISCSDDDDDKGGKGNTELAGTWKHSKTSAEVEVTNPAIKDQVVKAIEAMTDNVNNTYVFNLDGTFQAKKSDTETKGTYKLKNDKLTLTGDKDTENLLYKENKISSSKDVKSTVAKQLKLDEKEITKATLIDTYSKITK